MNNFNFNKFVNNLKSIKTIKQISNNESDNTITVEYNDGLKIYVVIGLNQFNKFHTIIDNKYINHYCYVAEMPHNSYNELYAEIYRMSSPNTRTKPCASPYFKSY